MVTVRKVYASDFEKIYPLLLELKNPSISRDAWKDLFVPRWRSPYDHFGYMLTDELNNAIGFLGTVFSTRTLRNKTYQFCNLTSWIVLPRYKAMGITLLFQALKLKQCVITNFSPSPAVSEVLKMARLREIDSSFRVLLPIPARRSGPDGPIKVVLDRSAIEPELSPEELTIMRDHGPFKCLHVLIRAGSRKCYCILTRVKRRRLPFAYVHFAGDLELFRKWIDSVRLTLCVRLRVVGLCVDERFLKGAARSWSFTMVQKKFTSQCDLSDEEIDNLYSELIILNN